MEAEVPVAEAEPRLPAERRNGRERSPGLVRTAPTALLVVQPGKCVEDRVEIGRDVQAEHVEIVADVPDDGHLRRAGDVDDAADEACAADASREDGDVHGVSTGRFASASCERGPSRRCSRWRSSIVSTSSTMFGMAATTTCRPSASACERNRAALSGP